MPELTLQKASLTDITEISRLANIIWNQHYPTIITQQQIDYMLNMMYSNKSLEEQLLQKGHVFYLINSGETSIGFISVVKEQNQDWFLNKFYIDQNLSSKGFGSLAFNRLKELIQAKKITLTVNRQNYKSVNFYFKLGFKIERVADFDIGNGYVMNDFVMQWQQK